MRPEELRCKPKPARRRAGGSALVPRRFAIGDEVAEDAGRAADAARPVDEVEEIAAAHLRSELLDDHDVAVAREAGAPALQVVAIDEVAARPVEQDIVGYADRVGGAIVRQAIHRRSEEHTSELQSLMRISYAVFCLKKK